MRWLDTRWRRYWTWHNFENVYFSRYTRNQTASINCSSTIFANVTKLRLQRAGYHFLFIYFFVIEILCQQLKTFLMMNLSDVLNSHLGSYSHLCPAYSSFFACELTASHNRKCCLVFVDSTVSGGECTFNYISINFRYFQWLIKKTAARRKRTTIAGCWIVRQTVTFDSCQHRVVLTESTWTAHPINDERIHTSKVQ